MRGRTLPSANFDNYGRVAGSDSFIKNLMFASPPLKIDIEPGKIDVAVVLLNINVLEDAAQSLGHHWLQRCIGLSPDPIARGLLSSRCSRRRCARILSDGTWPDKLHRRIFVRANWRSYALANDRCGHCWKRRQNARSEGMSLEPGTKASLANCCFA